MMKKLLSRFVLSSNLTGQLKNRIENIVENNGALGKFLLREIVPLLFVVSRSKNISDIKSRIKEYFFAKEILGSYINLVRTSSLGTAFELGIIDELNKKLNATADEIASNLNLNLPRTETLLDSLVYFGFLKKDGAFYSLDEDFKEVMKVLGDEIKFLWAQLKGFSDLPDIVRRGEPSSKLNIYNLESDYRTLLFSVNSFLYSATQELMEKFEFKSIRRIMIGSMGISFAKNIQKKFPDVQIHIGCYPHLIDEVPKLIEKYKLENIASIKKHKGIPKEDRWGDEEKGYDLVFLTKKLTLRPLDEFGSEFLEKSLKVLNKGGYAVIWEAIVSDDGLKGPIEESILDFLVSFYGKRWKESELKNYVLSKGFSDFKLVKCFAGKVTFGIAIK
jgi:hypothetical protein